MFSILTFSTPPATGTFLGLNPVQWSGISAMVSGVGLLIACAGAVFAGWQLRTSVQVRKAQSSPFVVVDVEPSPTGGGEMDIVIQNVGSTPAHDIKIRTNQPLVRGDTQADQAFPLAESGFLVDGIPMLAPGKSIRYYFDILDLRKQASPPLPMSYECEVTYRRRWKGKWIKCGPDPYVLWLDQNKRSWQAVVHNQHDLVREVHNIVDAIKAK